MNMHILITADLIQNLIGSGKPNLAVKFVLEFKLTHKFPLIAILKDIVESSRDVARKVRKDGKHSLQSLVILISSHYF